MYHINDTFYNRLCFGLNSAPAVFQSVIDKVLKDIPKICAFLNLLSLEVKILVNVRYYCILYLYVLLTFTYMSAKILKLYFGTVPITFLHINSTRCSEGKSVEFKISALLKYCFIFVQYPSTIFVHVPVCGFTKFLELLTVLCV